MSEAQIKYLKLAAASGLVVHGYGSFWNLKSMEDANMEIIDAREFRVFKDVTNFPASAPGDATKTGEET